MGGVRRDEQRGTARLGRHQPECTGGGGLPDPTLPAYEDDAPVEELVHGLMLLLLAAAVGGYRPRPVPSPARRTLNNIGSRREANAPCRRVCATHGISPA